MGGGSVANLAALGYVRFCFLTCVMRKQLVFLNDY